MKSFGSFVGLATIGNFIELFVIIKKELIKTNINRLKRSKKK